MRRTLLITTVGVVVAGIGLFALQWGFLAMGFDGHTSKYVNGNLDWGERLSIRDLQPHEVILIRKVVLPCLGDWSACEYWITNTGRLESAMFTAEPERTADGEILPKTGSVAHIHTFAADEAAGVQNFFAVLRLRIPNDSTATETYRIEYYRRGALIGVERHICPPFLWDLRYALSRREIKDETYERISMEVGLPVARLQTIFPVEMLHQETAATMD
jgi:hypothetical protein